MLRPGPKPLEDLPRLETLSRRAVKDFRLDLRGYNVLTEAASGRYMLTPLIAAAAGADKVFALAKDTRYGKASDIAAAIGAAAKAWGLGKRIEIFTSRTDPRISNADIVTNLGHVRPLDAQFLCRLKKTAAIPLMWEAWEFRPQDLDLAYCRENGIPVVGTDESHRLLRIMDYVGLLPVKLFLELGIEVANCKVAVAGGGKFGGAAATALKNSGAQVLRLTSRHLADKTALLKILKSCDALTFMEHEDRTPVFKCKLRFAEIADANPGLAVAHVAGNIDAPELAASGLRHLPQRIAQPGFMSLATDYIGPRPVIALHTAGLKLGLEMAAARRAGATVVQAEKAAVKTGFGQSLRFIKA